MSETDGSPVFEALQRSESDTAQLAAIRFLFTAAWGNDCKSEIRM